MRSQDYIYDTETHLALCPRINFSNLASSDQQHLEFYLSADFWHRRVNQQIRDKASPLLCSSDSEKILAEYTGNFS